MDTLKEYRAIIERVLQDYISFFSRGAIERELIVDCAQNHFIVMGLGWEEGRRVYNTIIHIDILNDKIWIQRDETRDGIAYELVQAGIPHDQIVLGFQPESDRPYTEFAVA